MNGLTISNGSEPCMHILTYYNLVARDARILTPPLTAPPARTDAGSYLPPCMTHGQDPPPSGTSLMQRLVCGHFR
jgi:hypothetical protein